MIPICLIAEDTPPVTYLLQTYAEMVGFQVVIAAEGERVLEIARNTHVQVVLLNVKLPGKMRGWEALKAIKAEAETKHIPVVIYQMDGNTEAFMANEADACLQMPVLYEGFVETLSRAKVDIAQFAGKRTEATERRLPNRKK